MASVLHHEESCKWIYQGHTSLAVKLKPLPAPTDPGRGSYKSADIVVFHQRT